ncbi:hypothetical protein HA402_008264 [Bradysia odoriphaga]|nr:hypothetical protein HA402_008264 [Bradysia odoriphaga]
MSTISSPTTNLSEAVPPLWRSCRLAFTVCAFCATMNLMFVKMHINFAIVCMNLKKTDVNSSSEVSFDWEKETVGHILSAFFYGYLLSLMLGGWLSQYLSARLCFIVGNAVAAVLNFLIPVSAYAGPWYLYAIRFLQGIFLGIMLPTIQLIFSSWSPADERTKLVSLSSMGYSVALILVNPITSLFCFLSPAMGWSYIFYFTGVLMVASAVAYYFVVFDSVHQHPRISTLEKEYILSGIGDQHEKKAIPYKSILSSVPVYAYYITHFCQVFGYAAISTTLPFFNKEALGLTVIQNGFISAIPAVLSTISRFIIGIFFKPVHALTKLSLTRFRKVNHVLGTLIPATFFLAVTLIPDNKITIIVLLCLSITICDLGYCGSYFPSFIDMAPSYTGFLSGIGCAIANLPFIVVSEILGNSIKEGTLEQYKILWYTCSATYIVGCIVYVSFGTSIRQRWG